MGGIPNLEAIRDWCKSMFQPLGNYAAPSDIPTQTSQLANDSEFITSEADNLANYYKKSETYNRSAADEKFAEKTAVPSKTSDLLNDSGYLTAVPVAEVGSAGAVKPDGSTITIDADGTIHAVSSQELAENILGGAS